MTGNAHDPEASRALPLPTTRLSRRLQSAISFRPDRLLPSFQLVGRGNPTDGALKTAIIIVLDVPPAKSQKLIK